MTQATGRTTKMLIEVLKAAIAHPQETIYIVVSAYNFRTYCKGILDRLCRTWEIKLPKNIRFVTTDANLQGVPSNNVFVDHFVNEQRRTR